MKTNRNLLIPIDFSHASKIAVRFALSNEYRHGDKLILLHSYRLISDDPEFKNQPRQLKLSIEQDLQKKYEDFKQALNLNLYGSDIIFIKKMGFTSKSIETLTDEQNIDLIIYGLKKDKNNHALIEIIEAGYSPVEIVTESMDFKKSEPLIKIKMSPSDFSSRSEYYISEAYAHPNTPYLVIQ